MSHYVHFDGMAWPRPDEPAAELEWILRYGEPTKSDLLTAASYVAAYCQLVQDPVRVRNEKIRSLRSATDRSA